MFKFSKTDHELDQFCFVYGEDRRLQKKALVSTGAFFRDKQNHFAYDSVNPCIGALVVHDRKGKTRVAGHCVVLFENSAQPYLFKEGTWAETCQSKSNILSDSRAEGIGMVEATIADAAMMDRWMPVLYITLAILGVVALIACVTAGLFDNVQEVF